ncbi:phosphoribosylformimino-5-aminoimidazole carboxamide ribotide isomerase [Thermocrinis albus DSM 14484]|uniref:1-(5-phosphoribosyl)-5-[(5-phosphoribosylamino)methylideneamino] imidazole-4-carboxamide isomerase n=1 Tax=Thermocrinis albus (strain DSM 14484 / JCM 11386 / HI 11/12) TaxID=638303 RepID=D3SLH5_THEAH|nr:phosphoribosylformimino-5-aminoimidazole carboxamide ribotide isomerase [Thermocrinis albus DSM 14484]
MNWKDFVIPAVDLKEGKVVRLVRGLMESAKSYQVSPEDMASLFQSKGFGKIHVVDLDGAVTGKPVNLEAIKNIRMVFGGRIQVGGGIRDIERLKMLDDIGVDLFVVGTVAVYDRRTFEKMLELFPNRVILSVDSKGGRVTVGGWKEETSLTPHQMALQYDHLPIWGYLYTNVDRDGTLEGVDPQPYLSFKKWVKKPVLASGGVASIEDVIKLMGVVEGVVVGKAIYEGRIPL